MSQSTAGFHLRILVPTVHVHVFSSFLSGSSSWWCVVLNFFDICNLRRYLGSVVLVIMPHTLVACSLRSLGKVSTDDLLLICGRR